MKQYLVCKDCGRPITHETTVYPHLFENEAEWEVFKGFTSDDEMAKFFSKKYKALRHEIAYTFIAANMLPVICPNCGCAAFDAFVPLGAVKGETAESINKIVDDKDMLRLALPFGTLRYQSYVQLGFLYKKLGLKKSAKVILEEAKNLEEVAPLHSVRVDGANVQNEAVAKIDRLLAGL